MTRDVPRFAEWLLNTFTSNESVAGDLAERYGAGRSYLWYWRQVLATIPMSLFREIRNNTLLSMRALVIGWGLVALSLPLQHGLVQFSLNLCVGPLSLRSAGMGPCPVWTARLPMFDLMPLTGLSSVLPDGWINAGWDVKHGWTEPWGGTLIVSALQFQALVFVLLSSIIALGLGWLIGRFTRPNSPRFVLLFVASWLTILILGFGGVVARTLHDWSLPVWRSGHLQFMATMITGNARCMLCTLAGGLLSAPAASGRALEGR